jgi:hypothetical protein
MGRPRSGARKLVIVASAMLLVFSILGFVGSLVYNAFLAGDYDAYGEVPIPGTATLHLPAGETTISFHSQIIGSTSGSGLPVSDLGLTIVPPSAIPDPPVSESIGATITVNGDARRRVWVAQIAEAGDYTIRTDGRVSAFISPRLSFGRSGSLDFLPWVFVGTSTASLLVLLTSTLTTRRTRRPVGQAWSTSTPSEPSVPGDEGIRLEQLKSLASLHSSGALTDEEFAAEKRRILES